MKRHRNILLWAGFGVTLLAFLSYFVFFARFPVTRDFPWANLILFIAGGWLLGIGLRRAFSESERYRGKVSGTVLSALSLLVFGFFLFYNFYLAKQLPSPSDAPHVGQKAPDFTLSDTNGKPVTLSELLAASSAGQNSAEKGNKAVLLDFYRGYW
ncbi:MAG: hypothetical protein HY236_07920 [Acidobacteria bacterium]|nr:hypothetical protein [Acidobacteriota bacterium]